MKVTDIVVSKNAPIVADKNIAKLLPTRIFPEKISFTINGVNNAVANALRRTISCELPVLSMVAEYTDVKTNDKHILPEMVIARLRMIPLDQTTPEVLVFELSATNATAQTRDVKSGEMKISNGKAKILPFNETFTICTLAPGTSITITGIKLYKGYAYNAGDGMQTLAYQVASVAVDQIPVDEFDPSAGGIHSREADPRVWKLSFGSHGTVPIKQIVAMACTNLVERLNVVKGNLQDIKFNGDFYTLTITGESDTIGNLFMKTICDEFKEVDSITYSTSNYERKAVIKVRYDETDIETIFVDTISILIGIFNKIQSYFK